LKVKLEVREVHGELSTLWNRSVGTRARDCSIPSAHAHASVTKFKYPRTVCIIK
jgi:hypothetical protein